MGPTTVKRAGIWRYVMASVAAHGVLAAALAAHGDALVLGDVHLADPNPPLAVDIVDFVEIDEPPNDLAIGSAVPAPSSSPTTAPGPTLDARAVAPPASVTGDADPDPWAPETPGALAMRSEPEASPTERRALPSKSVPRLAPLPDGVRMAIAAAEPEPERPIDPLAPLRTRKPPKQRSELRRTATGSYETNEPAFVARTRPDGRVELEDKRNFNIKLNLPDKRMIAGLVESWQADPYGHAMGESKVAVPTENLISGGFDITDALTRWMGDDPYSAAKLAFLERTREERAQIARKQTAESLQTSVANLRRHVSSIWRRTDMPASERRAILFELWDECAETGSPGELEAARAARATVLGFIRRELPAGSPDAYTADELGALNRARGSTMAFAPYPPR